MNGPDWLVESPVMMTLDDVALATGGRVEGANAAIQAVNTDSRAIAPGDLFVALVGERFDAHDFVEDAIRAGAAAAVTSRAVKGGVPIPQVVVDDTRLALGRLAAAWRARFALPLVALTGSNGKTTVKEMLAAILAARCGAPGAVLATQGNLNNDIGMPLTLLRLRSRHRYAVIEMGMNHAGEIDYLTRIASPTLALVNNAQRAHVGILGSVEAIARAKGEIYAGLGADGIALVNADEAFAGYWRGLNAGRRVVTFGLSSPAEVSARRAEGRVEFTMPGSTFAVALRVAGEHNVRNALAACAAAYALEVPAAAIEAGLSGFAGVAGRQQRRRGLQGATIIDDTYNANPESMKAAVDVLSQEPGRRIFVMGDMGELGPDAAAMHAEVGAFARARGIEALYTLGEASAQAAAAFGAGARAFADLEALVAALTPEAQAGTAILVKGSRFMRMERVAEALAGPGGAHAA